MPERVALQLHAAAMVLNQIEAVSTTHLFADHVSTTHITRGLQLLLLLLLCTQLSPEASRHLGALETPNNMNVAGMGGDAATKKRSIKGSASSEQPSQ